ncbi:MAG: hypothetical protein KAT75_03855, partial [Dehalococcoidia bacterium]|nr:hypothetical protein [Dehalococcoidia bacterium]
VDLTISEGTTGKTKEDEPLSEISVTEMEEPPVPPADSNVIGLTYDLGPDEATFDPPITLTFTYDPDEIPEGVSEENLVIAVWDEGASEWVTLEGCTVDPITHTITAPVSHFTAFTVLAYTHPATFTTSDLTLSPAEVDIERTVTISLLVTNTGDLTGSYQVTLKIDNITEATKEVSLAGGASRRVTFTTSKDVAGTYAANVDGLSGTFTVKLPPVPATFTTTGLTISPLGVNKGESVTFSVLVTNTGDLTGSYEVTLKINGVVVATEDVTLAGGASQKVTFTTAQEEAGTYSVTVDGLSGTFTVKAPPPPPPEVVPPPPEEVPPPPPVNWPLIGGIIAAVVVIGGLLGYFLWWRRRPA